MITENIITENTIFIESDNEFSYKDEIIIEYNISLTTMRSTCYSFLPWEDSQLLSTSIVRDNEVNKINLKYNFNFNKSNIINHLHQNKLIHKYKILNELIEIIKIIFSPEYKYDLSILKSINILYIYQLKIILINKNVLSSNYETVMSIDLTSLLNEINLSKSSLEMKSRTSPNDDTIFHIIPSLIILPLFLYHIFKIIK